MHYEFNPLTDNLDLVAVPKGGTTGQFLSKTSNADLDTSWVSSPSEVVVNTRENILALTPTVPTVALASDTDEYFIFDGTNWQEASLEMSASGNPDIGYFQSDKLGYYNDAITDKTLTNVLLKGSAKTEDGGIRIDFTQNPIVFQLYYNNQWNDLVPFDFDPPLTHTVAGTEYEVATGNSIELDITGEPIVKRYTTSIGAYAHKEYLDCGTF